MTKVEPTKRSILRLRLYISGNAPNSARAVANTRSICDDHFAELHKLEIIDMLTHPLRAMADGIIVTPTLLRLSPLPVRRVIGDLSDTREVLATLEGK